MGLTYFYCSHIPSFMTTFIDKAQTKIVQSVHIGSRLDACALALFPSLGTRSQAKKWIKKGYIVQNGHKANPARFVKIGDTVTLQPAAILPKPLDIPLEFAFEDSHIAVVNKPAGLFVRGRHPKTLVRALRQHAMLSTETDALAFVQPVHRLDQRTSGLVVCAKTKSAQVALGKAFETRQVQKKYHAIVCGHLGSGESTTPIEGKDAHTSWYPLQHVRSLHTDWLTVLEVQIQTGRTHQIRRHLSEIGHPILGDDLYTEGPVLKSKGLFLCATYLSFAHPVHQSPLTCHITPPDKFQNQLTRESQRWTKYHSE